MPSEKILNAKTEQVKNLAEKFKKANIENLAHDLVTRKVIDLLMKNNN